MKDKRIDNEQLEDLLRMAHLPEASPELKQRITAEARKAWKQTSAEVSWGIPLRRLVASAAAANSGSISPSMRKGRCSTVGTPSSLTR